MLKIIFLLFMAGGIPVAIAMAGASLTYILISGSLPPFVVIHRMVSGIDSFPLLAVPFFIAAVVMTVQMMEKIGNRTRMTIVDLPMNIVYGMCAIGFAAMAFRSVQVARVHWRRGYSVLERPLSTLDDQ